MKAPIAVPFLLLTAGTSNVLAKGMDRYERENGTLTSTPEATIPMVTDLVCAISCTAMEPWFCGGFTHHANGTCLLHEGNQDDACLGAPGSESPLEVDTSSERLSYRRLQSTCPGATSDPCDCPANFTRCADRCLTQLDQRVSNTEAEALCAERGAHLAVPRSEEENQCALDLADGKHTWLGVTDRDTDGVYVGADDGGQVTIPQWWAQGRPMFASGWNCIMTLGEGWYDQSCSFTALPLCQLRGSFQPVCP